MADRRLERGRPRPLRTASALVVVALVAASCGTAEAPVLPPAWIDAEAGRPLGHADFVRLATESAANAASFEAKRRAASAALRRAGLPPIPALHVEWEDLGLGLGAAGAAQLTTTVAASLAELVNRDRALRAAAGDHEAALARVLVEWRTVAAEAHRAYDRLVAARAGAALASETVAAAERDAGASRRLASAGAATRFDVEKAEAELIEARGDEARALADARVEELGVAFALGFGRPVHLELSEGLSLPGAPVPDVEAALERAAAARPELVASKARAAAELERLRIEVSRVRFLPALGFGPRTGGGPVRGVATLEVELPSLDGGAAAEDAQRAELLAAAADLRATAEKVASEVVTAREKLLAALDLLEHHARPLAEARLRLRDSTRRLFDAGELDFSALVTAARDEVLARKKLLDVESSVSESFVSLSLATATLFPPPPSLRP